MANSTSLVVRSGSPKVFFVPFQLLQRNISGKQTLKYFGPGDFNLAMQNYGFEHVFVVNMRTKLVLDQYQSDLEIFADNCHSLNLAENLSRNLAHIPVLICVSQPEHIITFVAEEIKPPFLKVGPEVASAAADSTALVKGEISEGDQQRALKYLEEMRALALGSHVDFAPLALGREIAEKMPDAPSMPLEELGLWGQYMFDRKLLSLKGYTLFTSLYPYNALDLLSILRRNLTEETLRQIFSPTEGISNLSQVLRQLSTFPGGDGQIELLKLSVPGSTMIIEAEMFPNIGIEIEEGWATAFYYLHGKQETEKLLNLLSELRDEQETKSKIASDHPLLTRLHEHNYQSAEEVIKDLKIILGLAT